ncbi:MAG: TraB/GumN family protein [Rhodobacteraceae bacterium]|nr:TraB/GumN family protein [Paracoccaceae bacterium]
MLRLVVAVLLLLPGLALAGCPGTDLLSAMPPDRLAALRDTAAQHPYPNGILWRADKPGRVVHLLGTMHLPDPRHQITLHRIGPMIAAAETVFGELGEGDEARLQRRIAADPQLAFITDGPTLPDLLAPADWDRLRTAMAERGTPGFLAAKMKPWMAALSLGLSECAMQSMQQGERGLDHAVIARATELGKTPAALEPIDTALNLFATYSQAEQLEMLRVSLAQLPDNPDDQIATVAEAYFRGEIRLLWDWSIAQALAYPGYGEDEVLAEMARLEEVLVIARNRNWLPLILQATETGEVLVAVGAMHLPGNSGLLNLLAAEGYRITRLPLHP